MAEVERILVVGGGIAGLTLANALHQRAFTIELVERDRSWPAMGAGIAVQPNGMRMLYALGLGAAVKQVGAVIRTWSFCNQPGEVLCATNLDALWGGVAPFIGIERTKLHQVLVAGTAAIPHRLGTSLVSLTQAGHRVVVGFNDGSTGSTILSSELTEFHLLCADSR